MDYTIIGLLDKARNPLPGVLPEIERCHISMEEQFEITASVYRWQSILDLLPDDP